MQARAGERAPGYTDLLCTRPGPPASPSSPPAALPKHSPAWALGEPCGQRPHPNTRPCHHHLSPRGWGMSGIRASCSPAELVSSFLNTGVSSNLPPSSSSPSHLYWLSQEKNLSPQPIIPFCKSKTALNPTG